MFEQQLQVISRDAKGYLECTRKGKTLRIASKVVSLKCVSGACFFAILMESQAYKGLDIGL